MKSIKPFLVLLIALALVSFTPAASGGTPKEVAPGAAARQTPVGPQLVPPTKFVKARRPIPNTYIVVLDDEAVPPSRSLDETRARVSDIARRFAAAHGGQVGFVYEAALRGFSIRLPSEAAAMAISRSPQVKYVEEAGVIPLMTDEPTGSWGLDRIDQMTGRNSIYTYNATGAGVVAYVIDSGIRATHSEFGGRASIAADFIGNIGEGCFITGTNNDCLGHGTSVASIIGGVNFGVAKQVTIRSLKACYLNPFTGNGDCDVPAVVAAVNHVTAEHVNNPSTPKVANMSLGGDQSFDPQFTVNNAVNNSINQGVTYAVSAGNSNDNADFFFPANVAAALTVGASDINDARAIFCCGQASNFGPALDLFAPGKDVPAATSASDTSSTNFFGGTSAASPYVAGAVALYLQGRAGRSACSAAPIGGVANTSGGAVSTCPDRVSQFIKSNTSLSVLSNVGGFDRNGNFVTSPNRLLFTGSLQTTTNPIDNQRFFVWQHYGDFPLGQPEPDEGGLNFWTGNITGTCGTGFNDNNSCTRAKRIDVSRAFWVAAYPWLFTPSYGTTDNYTFVHLCYELYLRRSVPDTDPGFQFWLNDLNNYGNPANQAGVNKLIDAFLTSLEYRQRFGQP
jgi:subtilisin family serine protease